MYPLLILRAEVVCMIILIFLLFTSHHYRVYEDSKAFRKILLFAIIHVSFDIITVLTVNNLDIFHGWINLVCHILFYLSALLFANEIANYVVTLCYPVKAKQLYIIGYVLIGLYIVSLPFLNIDYKYSLGTYSSTGPAAYVGYGLAFSFFIFALVLLFTHLDRIPTSVRNALVPMMLVLMVTEILQILRRDFLFTGGAATIVTVGFFFALENPVEVFKKKAMTDALTGVLSRSCYEEDIDILDRGFKARPSDEYIFVFCDINDLRNVNNHFGHGEGDNYITLIASAISECMVQSSAVYRIGGDEFLIFYYQVSAQEVEKEIKNLHKACEKASEELNYTAGVSVGFAQSSPSYSSLKDLVKTADYTMYENKRRKKAVIDNETAFLGTKLNYTGLTDRLFDAMCASDGRNYLFITNLDTNVTRIDPDWNEYFGLGGEFFVDFQSIWKERIHPDDYDGYMEDTMAVLSGHKQYHDYTYFAKRFNGEYVKMSCHGSVYRDNLTNINYFTGYVTNFGLDENKDAVTGLKNTDYLTTRVCTLMDNEKPFSVIKFKLKNFARVNMIYGYSGGDKVLVKIAKVLSEELPCKGQAFCQGAVNFTVLLETTDRKLIEGYYKKILTICANGLDTEVGSVPILISGGALMNTGKRLAIQTMRSNLVFALEESQYSRRDELVFCNESEMNDRESDVSLLARIHNDALDKMKYFQLFFQPIVNTSSGKTIGAEALLRWIHPDYGVIPPGEFIDFIETDPCYYRLGLGILKHSIIAAKRFSEVIPNFRINVNITALQLQNELFIDDIFKLLNEYDYPAHNLVLELTERCKEMDGVFLSQKISEIRNRGLQVAFDDLGTGYSTINLLMNIPVDEIKLDRDFVCQLKNRDNYQLFVQALVTGSRSDSNDFTICFEGIEDEEILDIVKGFGNFLAQGYYFSKPIPEQDFLEYIARENQ